MKDRSRPRFLIARQKNFQVCGKMLLVKKSGHHVKEKQQFFLLVYSKLTDNLKCFWNHLSTKVAIWMYFL
jgi:hypothetical protein